MPTPSSLRDARAEYYWTRVREEGRRFRAFDWPSVELILNLVTTYDALTTDIERLIARFGLSLSAFNVLAILSRSEKKCLKQQEVSELLLVSRANVTGLVDSLVKRRLVERAADRRDRRVRFVKLTRKGEALLEELLPAHYENVARLLAHLGASEKKNLSRLLEKVRSRAPRQTA